MKQFKTSKKHILLLIVIVLFAIGAFVIVSSPKNTPTGTALHPQNGQYTITRIDSMECTLAQPPACTGRVLLTSEGVGELEAKVDRDTQVRYQSKELQLYPSGLTQGMTGQVTFKQNSNIIATMVIAD